MDKLSPVARWLALIATVILPVAYFKPIWKIQLWAPQYPEGLQMNIWINKLSGEVNIINQLNHYIGMEKITEGTFPELNYMVYLLAFLIVFGLLTFIINRRFMLNLFAALLVIAAVAALVDFYKWGYRYGHNLDPEAPIKIEGASYQPPLIGYKQLLNFTALSIPDSGGWALFGAGIITTIAVFINFLRHRKMVRAGHLAGLLLLPLMMYSCSAGPEPLKFGKDVCSFCGMKLVDEKYGAEIVTEKGKVYKFDDIGCMLNYEKGMTSEKVSQELVTDFAKPGNLVDARKAFYLEGGDIKSPMGSNVAGFSKEDDMGRYSSQLHAEKASWENISSSNGK